MRTWMLISVGLGLALGPAAAGALSVSGPGLDDGGACPQSAGACGVSDYDFVVVPAAATGDINFTFNGGTSWTLDIVDLTVSSITLEDTGGAIDGVDNIVFTDLVFNVSGWSAFESAGQILGLATTGTVSGSYEQFLGAGSVAGPTVFATALSPDTIGAGSLICDASLSGQCGFTFGFAPPELALNVGTTGGGSPYEFVFTFNVVVPEPSTAALLGLGLVGLVVVRKQRA